MTRNEIGHSESLSKTMAGDEKIGSETNSLMKICKDFGGCTSMHGIGRALNNRNPCSRFLWTVITVLGLGASVYQFVLTLTDFYSYPMTTVVTVKQETNSTFPGITICNINRKRSSKIDDLLEEDLANFTETEVSPNDARLNALMQQADTYNADDSDHQIEDMLIKCVFNRDICSEDNFTHMFTATYGKCYTFNVQPNPKRAARPGPQSGLILELNIEQYEYLPTTYKAGVKVIVHPNDEKPFPEDGGILAQPGTATSIGVRKELTLRLPSPYSKCISAQGHSSAQQNLFPDKKYTQAACMKSCYQLRLLERCQCCDVDVPCPCESTTNCNRTYCDDDVYLICEFEIEDEFLRGDLKCDERCPPACDSATFDTVVSTAQWPSDSYFDRFVQKINASVLVNRTFASNSSLRRFVNANFLRLEIFLDSLDVIELAAQPKYDWNMLLGTLGGQLGLWLGFSLLTALEITELLVDAVSFCVRRRCKKKPTARADQNERQH